MPYRNTPEQEQASGTGERARRARALARPGAIVGIGLLFGVLTTWAPIEVFIFVAAICCIALIVGGSLPGRPKPMGLALGVFLGACARWATSYIASILVGVGIAFVLVGVWAWIIEAPR